MYVELQEPIISSKHMDYRNNSICHVDSMQAEMMNYRPRETRNQGRPLDCQKTQAEKIYLA
jgi:hypothetical protein